MYRREKSRAHQLRMWKRYHRLRSASWLGLFFEAPAWSQQKGYFRKSSGLGCPAGRSKCIVCNRGTEPTRQEMRAEINYEEYMAEML